MTKTYIAITIGPIYKTFQTVRKTRELWAASYIFSYISKRMIQEILKIDHQALLSPHYDEKATIGIGLYPDRIFLDAGNNLTIEIIERLKKTVIAQIATWFNKTEAEQFLTRYFRIYSVAYSTDESENPLIAGNNLLDTAELRNSWDLEENTNFLLIFLRSVNLQKVNNRKWILDHLDEKDINGEVRFLSMPEISTRDINTVNAPLYKSLVKKYCYTDMDLDNDDGFIKDLQKGLNLKGKPDLFKNYHKYVCIVKADGDQVGKYIKAITTNFEHDINELSVALYNWGVASAQLIREYTGVPIYVGGDDLLFLAPVAGKDGDSILELIEKLNNSFIQHFLLLPKRLDDKKNEIKPTLSFGLSITYYKFPLFEALEKANLLLAKAKETRNTCAVSLLKHSGSHFDVTLLNDPAADIRKSFNEASTYFTEDKSFLSSIIHHFRQNEEVYQIVGEDFQKVMIFLKNNFDNAKHAKFVECVASLCYHVYKKNHGTAGKDESEKSVDEIYSLLRILKFLKGQEDGK